MSTDYRRYLAAAHAMQSGVAAELAADAESASCTPKHLRVGVNVAMCDHAALVRLLVEKGIITTEEYEKAVADEMEREVERYEKRLSDRFGKKITLA